MSSAEPLIRTISDTALWAAMYRASENDRPDAVFRDPFAKRLAGSRGQEIATSMPFSERQTWAWIARTYLVDQFITEQLAQGVDMVVNLAAGLDARPYRMDLPSSLKWIEVDLLELLSYKESILKDEVPGCRLERVALDLSNAAARRELFDRLARQASKVLIITEGILVYLSAEEVIALAQDLRAPDRVCALGHRPGIAGTAADPSAPSPAEAQRGRRNVEIRPQRRTVVFRASWMETHRCANIAQDGGASQSALVLDAAGGQAS